ncbi:hypothetical protein [Mucilaginibacter paludis]|uniref:FG-GAP repeat protein n=1 Tax=Mucilaginibacter paludis DSM 18603 TaxID=714943 RepID=H1YDF1_9SPHI|nr:hypothetical protein [Mucilaginibacter paludis]EHQ30160.1 FG-GAP repeat protein [Mucilaginibacter paludis DSM 18603]
MIPTAAKGLGKFDEEMLPWLYKSSLSMKPVAILITLLLAACNANQKPVTVAKTIARKEIMFPFGDTTFHWKQIEKQNDTLKERFMKVAAKLLQNEYSYYNQNEPSTPSLSDFKQALHVVDFNGDGQDDLVFDGDSGGEPKVIAFILNTIAGFKIVFKDMQYVKRFDFDDKHRIESVYLQDPGCCDAHMTFNKIYHIEYRLAKPVFKRIYFTGHHQDTYFPKTYFSEPFRFEVLNNHYKIRTKPMIDDTCTTFISGDPLKGDAIGELRKGTRGRAIASQADKTGRLWWLVELDLKSKIKTSVFYDDEDMGISSKVGWISSRYAKKI